MTPELCDVLRQYAEAYERRAFALQRLDGAGELERLGLLRWCGRSWGTHFYTITEDGLAAQQKNGKP